MKKVLIFNGYYHPSRNCGGPITSIENIVNGCSDKFNFYIICYNHDFNDMTPFNKNTNQWYSVGNAKVMYVKQGYLDFSISNMQRLFDELRPDLIWFSGVLTPNNKIVSVKIAKKYNIPVLFSPRGEVSEDRVKIKAFKKIPYLRILKLFRIYGGCYFHGTSDDEIEGIKKYFNPSQNHIFKVANISILPQKDVIEHPKHIGKVSLFFFSRIHEVKNLKYAIEAVLQCKKKVIFDIYGPIESEEYWNECQRLIETAPSNICIKHRGIIDHNNLSHTIQQYDAFLFPTTNENYGHVIAESLANSRPVILSKGTTPWDDLDGEAGYAISLVHRDIFTEIIDEMAEMDEIAYTNFIHSTKEYFRRKIEKDGAVKGHIDMLNNILEQSNKE